MAGVRASLPSLTIVRMRKRPASATDPAPVLSDPAYETRNRVLDSRGEQGSLFSNEELIIPQSVRTMRKAVSAIHAVPINPEHSPSINSRRLFDACIIVAQLEFRGEEDEVMKRLKEERISPVFEIRTSALAKLASIPGKNYQRIYEELNQLYEMSLFWNILNEDGTVEWEMKSHFFSSLGIGQGDKKGLIRFSFDPSVLALVLEPKVWAKLSLDVMGRFRTAASYALYQNTWRYVGTQNKVTAPLPVEVWAELLLGKTSYVSQDKDGPKLVRYGDFKRRILVPAIESVNKVPALAYTLKLKEIKSGTRVTRLQFEFVAKQQRPLNLPFTWPSDVVSVLQQLGYSHPDIDDMSQAHALNEVVDAINRLERAQARLRQQGKPLVSRRGYFEGILRNIHGAEGQGGEEPNEDRILSEVRAEEAKQAAKKRMERLQESFRQHQHERFCQWFFEQSASVQGELAEGFLSDPDTAATVRNMMKLPLTAKDRSGLTLIRGWLNTARPELYAQSLPHPEDTSFESWMAWRLAEDL